MKINELKNRILMRIKDEDNLLKKDIELLLGFYEKELKEKIDEVKESVENYRNGGGWFDSYGLIYEIDNIFKELITSQDDSEVKDGKK